ncbi:MAG: hypothetical protein A2161_18530 [Candidatus Schekmanbacteria bacterium RBG_13_48_7]|uniref:Uncharacterized protein n=1 Tax=Candidatus Schekmanbacteria bacterium RBG_13_48_7 TaxID=1817878 RepID=A0A1F7S2P0_9BACT|nr:MAG: hypothetical protein A2161_18530 [Candidatus Schekmanbacteria bacterium RBG_13_48_7]
MIAHLETVREIHKNDLLDGYGCENNHDLHTCINQGWKRSSESHGFFKMKTVKNRLIRKPYNSLENYFY